MRIGAIIGTVTLSRSHPALAGGTFKLAAPLSLANLTTGSPAAGEPIVIYDELGAGIGSQIAMSEGAEAAQPFRPHVKPLDAYNAAILDELDLNER